MPGMYLAIVAVVAMLVVKGWESNGNSREAAMAAAEEAFAGRAAAVQCIRGGGGGGNSSGIGKKKRQGQWQWQ
jgi:hypothetical protein